MDLCVSKLEPWRSVPGYSITQGWLVFKYNFGWLNIGDSERSSSLVWGSTSLCSQDLEEG